MLWGALTLGIETVLIATGDFVALGDRATTTQVGDADVFGLVEIASDDRLIVPASSSTRPRSPVGSAEPVRPGLKRKIQAGVPSLSSPSRLCGGTRADKLSYGHQAHRHTVPPGHPAAPLAASCRFFCTKKSHLNVAAKRLRKTDGVPRVLWPKDIPNARKNTQTRPPDAFPGACLFNPLQ